MINKPTILVVDDAPENIELLSGVLRPHYKVKAATYGDKALQIVNGKQRPDMILLDIMMPGMDGYEVCRRLKSDPATSSIPVIFFTAMSEEEDEEKGLNLGAVDYIPKPIRPAIVLARIRTHLALYDQNRELEEKVRERTEELHDTRLEVIRRLSRAAEFRDDQTGLHVTRMSHYARLIAQALNVSDEWTDLVFSAAPMHDVGKIAIPDKILLKPGRLNGDEWEIMKMHSLHGAEIIGDHPSEVMQMAKVVALTHHEKWDGAGYPKGLKGTDIPLAGRIVALADVFDSLVSERCYKKAWAVEEAVVYIDEHSGRQFDPELVELFHSCLDDILKIKQEFPDKESLNIIDFSKA